VTLSIWIVEDNLSLSRALKAGLEGGGAARVLGQFDRGEEALARAPCRNRRMPS
jgi:hypothetical protein